MQSKQEKILSPKIDVVFQALFGEVGSERITKRFLESILNEKIESIDLGQNPVLRRQYNTDKLGILDIMAKINGKENCHIELQVGKQDFIIERLLYYWSRVYSRSLRKSNNYNKLERTIAILIADFELKGLEEVEYVTKWKIIEEKNRKLILTDKLEIVILELNKIKGKEEVEGELLDWLFFIDNPESERVKEKMKKNKELKEAGTKLKTMSRAEYRERMAWFREKAILDYNSGMSSAREQGIEQGIEQGERKAKLETAKRMLEKHIPISTISELTGLSQKEIEECKVNY